MASFPSNGIEDLRNRVVGSTGALLGALVTVTGSFAVFRPNRVINGVPATAVDALGSAGWLLVACWVAMLVFAVLPTRRAGALARGLLASGVLAGSLLAVSNAGLAYAASEGDIARVSLGYSFWLSLLAVYFVIYSAREALESSWARALVNWSGPAALVALLVTGRLAGLSIVREYLMSSDTFWRSFRQHLYYTLGATGVALVIGVGLGILAAKRVRTEGPVFGVLNVTQVLPTLSFIGLLIAPMAWLGSNVGLFDAIGVSGIGWAPVFVVLVSYAVFPITRNTYSALKTLEGGVVDAARGVGMNWRQRLAIVELPLSVPIVLAGVRIALVQTTAGAIIAGLVGGGGLGAIVFYGLQQTAEDLVLLGVIPIVVLALMLDGIVRVAVSVFGELPEEVPA